MTRSTRAYSSVCAAVQPTQSVPGGRLLSQLLLKSRYGGLHSLASLPQPAVKYGGVYQVCAEEEEEEEVL
ncbi:hypothetical protein NQZ68_031574 [Dissostichus eleginoides]|nr:hypothetical protein NQZ68_031574 [Dissostichus eleginoides]